jgi:NAD(P)H-dependent FMN reductase
VSLGAEASPAQVLLICGSTREGSSNRAVLEAVHRLDLPGVRIDLYDGLSQLPAFVPGEQSVPEPVSDLLGRITRADAVLLSTPEYAGSLPGSLKNLLDWTVGGGELFTKPVAWLDVANPGRGEGARAQLRVVLGYVGARIVDAACVHIGVERRDERITVPSGEHSRLAGAIAALLAEPSA